MATERTLSIIKPNAIQKNIIGEIIRRLENAGLKIVAAKMLQMSKERTEAFYEEHRGKPFFEKLVDSMSNKPILVQVLEGENAISKNREVMGSTNPTNAAPGTIRADFADSITENAVHGSDAPETAKREIAFFFDTEEIFSC